MRRRSVRPHRPTLGLAAIALTLLVSGALAGCSPDQPTAPGTSSATGTESTGTENTEGPGSDAPSLVRVPEDAATITEAVDTVAPGGMVLVGPGVYEEEVRITTPDVTLRGLDRNETVIDGGGTRNFGVVGAADGVRIQNLTVRSTLFYGVLVTSVQDENGPLGQGGPGYDAVDPSKFPPLDRYSIDHVTAANNGLYGIYAFNAQHGSITNSYASGAADSGFYVGQCTDCDALVTGNVAERNAVGFENANASTSLVIAGNRFSGNRIGMTLISSYQEAFTPQRDNVVVGNLLIDNTNPDSPAQALGGFGVGLAITGGQGNRVENNRFEGNSVAGALIGNAEDIPATGNRLARNVFASNGVDVTDISTDRAPSSGNCFEDNTATTALPETLLTATCAAGTPEGPGAQSGLPEVTVPPGTSFLKVTAPPAQPGIEDPEEVPSPLPATTTMPDVATFAVPDVTFLAENAGTAR